MRSFFLPCFAVAVAVPTSCSPARPPAGAHDSANIQVAGGPRFCSTPRDGLVISPTRVGLFPTRATTAELDRLCDAGASVLYDAVGWQAPGEEFAFHGARITAVISQAQNRPHLPDVPDLWTAEGDSLRLEDGQLVPRTLGELRTRYGQAVTDDNVDPGADDFDGFGTVSCRFPYLLFKLGFNGHGIIPDSARISSLEMWVPPPSGFDRVCHR
jgi:hypothetical protein